MVKMLKHALGMTGEPGLGVVGRVEQSTAGNSVLHVGKPVGGGAWGKVVDGGHIALMPDEREELIETLESHRDYQVIEIGDVVSGATVIAVQYVNAGSDGRNLRGTVLAYNYSKREWVVWTASPQGSVEHGTRTFDQQQALNAFSVRTTEHLYLKFNTSPPALTFGHVAERDKLEG